MDGEQNGVQETQQQESGQQQAAQQQKQETQQAETGAGTAAFEAQLAERDARIEELEGQIAEASKNAETADALREEIAALKQQGESDRIDFALQLAGCRNVKAARAVLEDHGGDVEAGNELQRVQVAPEADVFTFAQIALHEGVTVKGEDLSSASAVDLLSGGEYTAVASPAKSNLGNYYELTGVGADINFMVVEKSAVIKFDKHVASRVFSPDELESLDSYMMKYRKYGIVELFDNKLDGVYVSARTS